MSTVFHICRREIIAFFSSLAGYVLVILFLGISGFFTWLYGSDVFFIGQANLNSFFNTAFWTLFFFIPAITMRSLAEEKRSGTLEWLITHPVTEARVVLGKWLACWVLVAVSLLLTLPYYLTIAWLGPVDHGAAVGGYLGLLMISAIYIGIGIFASSLTVNQIVAYLIALFTGFVFHTLFDLISGTLTGTTSTLLAYAGTTFHFETMARGVISLDNMVYGLSVTAFSLCLATVNLKRRLWL